MSLLLVAVGLAAYLGQPIREDLLGGGWFEPESTAKSLLTNAVALETDAELGLRQADAARMARARRTGDYLVRDLQSPEGPFWLGESGDLGDFYMWTCAEASQVLGPVDCEELGLGLDPGLPSGGETGQLNALYLARLERLPPATDTRIDRETNAVAVASLARAGSLLGQAHWVAAAERAALALKLEGATALELHQATGKVEWLRAGGALPATIALVVAEREDPGRDFFREAVLNQASDELFLVTLTPGELNDLGVFELPAPSVAQICREKACEAGTAELELWIQTLESLR